MEGTVKVMVDYDENGNVVSATLVDSSGHTVLDEAVLETVRERYRLRDNSGSGSTVLSVDMTIDGSDFNREAQERGDRREVNIPPPHPVAAEEVPTNEATTPTETTPPAIAPSESVLRDVPPESPSPEPAEPPVAPSPEAATTQTPSAPSVLEAVPSVLEAVPSPEAPAVLQPAPEPTYVPPPEPVNEPLPEPVYEAFPILIDEEPSEAAPASEAPATSTAQ
jgi:TonB family protein